MDTDETISLPKSDPAIADMFSECKPGDDVKLTITYGGKSATLAITVEGDDDQTFTGTVNDVTAGDGDEGAETEEQPEAGEEPEDETPAAPAKGGKAMSPMDYIKSKRK